MANGSFAELSQWWRILERAGIPIDQAVAIASRAAANGVSLPMELLASGALDEERLYRELARELGVSFLTRIDAERLILRERDFAVLLGRAGGPSAVKAEQPAGMTALLLAPTRLDVDALGERIQRSQTMAGRIKIVTPRLLRSAVVARATDTLKRDACGRLFALFPNQSARIVANAWQSVLVGASLVGLPVAIFSAPSATGLFIHLFFSLFFLACVSLRFAAVMAAGPPMPARLKQFTPEELPVYSVLVALYKEADIIPDLLVALGKIVWPRGKLEIKLVCEADDHATLAALRAHRLQSFVEIIEVPTGGPRTKPKALAHALPMTAGEFVVLYDAEDRPHPLQLIEAWQRFRDSDKMLACLQAPLVVANYRQSNLSRMFAFEYAALFRGLLPWLSSRNLVIPLGGTSNHLRKSALEAVGGWDPFNVTEDADLGLRLARHGYRVDTITRPTYEDAPETFANWLPQRTRWFKGWMQTWLVHMRRPAALYRDLGPASFLVSQILLSGMVVSSLAHPIFLSTLFYISLLLAAHRTVGTVQSSILIVDIVNITLGYSTFLLLGRQTLVGGERSAFWKTVLLTPLYWLLISLAAWRALWKLYREPHHWEKTHHPGRSRTRTTRASTMAR